MDSISTIHPHQLAALIKGKMDRALVVDCRSFCEFNSSHIVGAGNVWASKIRKKRLQQNSASVTDYLHQASGRPLGSEPPRQVIVYDQSTKQARNVSQDSFLYVFLSKLSKVVKEVGLLAGGFLVFSSLHPSLCESPSPRTPLPMMTTLSQPCLPAASRGGPGPSRVLPFLYLGSQNDANNQQLLLENNISFELNVSTSCPKPEFVQESNFMRIPVNDNFSEKLLPYFHEAFKFIDNAREAGQRILVHCLAGISRSPTVSIAFVMKHLHLHYDEAYRYVKSCRPTISPNINFVGQLLELDRQLNGDKILYRSPTAPIFFHDHEHDFCYDLTTPATDHSYVLKSCSVSCIESAKENFPFGLKRSLPSLVLKSIFDKDDSNSSKHMGDLDSASSQFSNPFSPRPSKLSPLVLFSSSKEHPRLTDSSNNLAPTTPPSPNSPISPLCHDEIYDHYLNQTNESKRNSENDDVVDGGDNAPKCLKLNSSEHFKSKSTSSLSNFGEISSKNISFSLDLDKSHGSNTCTNTDTKNADVKMCSYSTTACIDLDCPPSDVVNKDFPKCIIEVSHEQAPITYHVDSGEPMIVRETQRVATPLSSCSGSESPFSFARQKTTEDDPPIKSSNEIIIPIQVVSEASQSPQPFLMDKQKIRMPISPLEGKSPNNLNPGTPPIPPSTSPTFTLRNPLRRSDTKAHNSCYEPRQHSSHSKQIPRCYSSSETHLNTRRILESNAAAIKANDQQHSCARKSFSSGEVGKGWSQHPTSYAPTSNSSTSSVGTVPTSQSSNSSHSPMLVNNCSLDLTRCDSWSTSGLGSEISDWESLQELDSNSIMTEDAQGPYDAVFSDVFPGGDCFDSMSCKNSLSKDSFLSERLSDVGKPLASRPKMLRQQQMRSMDSDGLSISDTKPLKNDSVKDLNESLGSSPAPRPMSLPGVIGMYDLKGCEEPSSQLDIGLGLEASPDWKVDTKEEMFTYGNEPVAKSSLTEHPPADARTMGESVRHTMTWYKIDSWPTPTNSPQDSTLSALKSEPNLTNPNLDSKPLSHETTSLEDKQTILVDKLKKPSPDKLNLSDSYADTTKRLFISEASDKNGNDIKITRSEDNSSLFPRDLLLEKKIDSLKSLYANPLSEKKPIVDFELRKTAKMKSEELSIKSKMKELGTLEERWKWWDNEFKKKMESIRNNVTLNSWEDVNEQMTPVKETELTGFHLTQELMQSMEDILESEISDIKRQASAISSKFSLDLRDVTPPSGQSPSSFKSNNHSWSGGGESSSEKSSPAISLSSKSNEYNDNSSHGYSPGIYPKSVSITPQPSKSPTSSSQADDASPHSPAQAYLPPLSVGKYRTPKEIKQALSTLCSPRSKSEPPFTSDDGLYRARSCPGISQQQAIEHNASLLSASGPTNINMRRQSQHLIPSASSKHSSEKYANRFSCGALDFVFQPSQTFESCPDMSNSKVQPLIGLPKGDGSNRPSFSRLLQVS